MSLDTFTMFVDILVKNMSEILDRYRMDVIK